MKRRNLWLSLLSSGMLIVMMGTTLHGGGDNPPALNSGDLSGVDVIITPLSSVNVEIGQEIDFELIIRNTSDTPRWFWLWFTVRLQEQEHEKMVYTPYLNKDSPFAGMIPANSKAVFELNVRALDKRQIGFYTFVAKVGPYVEPFDRLWVSAADSFNGYILGDVTNSRPSDTGDGGWVIVSIRAVNETGRTFLEGIGGALPRAVSMIQNYPNPFNPSTNIIFEVNPAVGMTAPVKLAVYDLRGRLVRSLVDEDRSPGVYTVKWDGRNEKGLAVGSGLYFFRLESGREVSIRKGVVTK